MDLEHGSGRLPFLDEHTVVVDADPARVWTALRSYVDASLARTARSPLTLLLGTEPRAGFEVAAEVPAERLTLAGRHRFAGYELSFRLTGLPDGRTRLTASTCAVFPGARGRAYRALVVGSRGHVVVTRHLDRKSVV